MYTLPKLDEEKVNEEICLFIQDKVSKANCDGIVIGLSGGIDSTVSAYLSVEAIGCENVFGIHMYSSTTPKEDTDHARLMARLLDIRYKEVNIDSISDEFIKMAHRDGKYSDDAVQLADGNLKARIRMCLLYYYANLTNSLVVGTGNKSELYIGYFTKYGDGGCDMEPIGDIYKTQLRSLARAWKIPEEIIVKPPRAGLWPGQTDEDEIGLSYELLDKLLYMAIDKNLDNKTIRDSLNISDDTINLIRNKVINSRHKIEVPESPKVSDFKI
ncbi:NAD+ synthase [uncultured Methanobrevibacter sp.]|uniref:NAD+ synthase n=1 Tax=uncultured Methanobrevibacter sp. TaxID=253161 RepID=UPI00258A30E4|nr:NAD+ synthase [uncultured Methanobrevibacter sp.]